MTIFVQKILRACLMINLLLLGVRAGAQFPACAPVQLRDGSLYGTTIGTAYGSHSTIYKLSRGKLTILYTFSDSRLGDNGNLIAGWDGNLYGTTSNGGYGGYGTIFRITPSGIFTTLHSFNGSDGAIPYAGLLLGQDGKFYGTTLRGGANGVGTIYNITPSGQFTLLHSISNQEGEWCVARLVQTHDGTLFGTALFHDEDANTLGSYESSLGCVFKLRKDGTYKVIHKFNGLDGYYPWGGVTVGPDGNLYGVTYDWGPGMAYRISPDGDFTTLHDFDRERDYTGNEGFPIGGCLFPLVWVKDGFYGISGAYGGFPSVFKMTLDGMVSVIQYGLTGNDEEQPQGIAIGNDALYGAIGSPYGASYGSVFKVKTDGDFTILWNF